VRELKNVIKNEKDKTERFKKILVDVKNKKYALPIKE
jgi:hypothetical protein